MKEEPRGREADAFRDLARSESARADSDLASVRTDDDETTELLAAVRALATQVGDLQAEVLALRTHAPSLPHAEADAPGWDDRVPVRRETAAWLRSLDSPSVRRPAVPRLLLEIGFLVAVATLAAIAGVDSFAVVALMLGAWLLVALAEWFAARAARRRDEIVYGPVVAAAPGFGEDPSWFAPPTERTALEITDARQATGTRLPPTRPD